MRWPAGPFYGLGPAWADHQTSWAVQPEDVPEDEGRTNQLLYLLANLKSGALLTRYAFGDDTMGSRGFITAVTRTAWPLLRAAGLEGDSGAGL
jgi:hypothetical protein